jgi:hypothetical protein
MSTPVSGPGQFSKRTDKAVSEANRSLPNADYGEQAAYKEQMAAAPLPNTSMDVTGMNFNDLFGNAANNVIPIDAESAMPDIPVTDGAAAGPGQGSEAIQQKQADNYLASWIPALEFLVNQPGTSDAARNIVRQLKSQL